MKDVLITGASIAGPALAWWLDRFGFRPVLVERAPAPRAGGHAIDIRGVALDLVAAMGLSDAVTAARTRMTGMSKLDAAGNEVWRSEEMTITGGSFGTDSLEVMRDDLSRILMGALPGRVETLYDDSVKAIAEDADGVTATLAKSGERRFHLAVGADGLMSGMRKLAFGPDSDFIVPFNYVLAPFSVPNRLGLTDWQISYDTGDGRCLIYTAPDNESLRICLSFDAPFGEVPAGRTAQIALLRKKCGHLGWEVPHFLDMLGQSGDFYMGAIGQVRMDRWTRGRVALVGDAGYCPSPFTGQGTSLAIVGGYVLAWELAQTPEDHARAFAAYEDRMRPFVEVNHAIAPLSRDPRFNSEPGYYMNVIEPALARAERAIELPGF
jgi:2-polyprenyl-6-methoxyphenol hydroxylase-like FAD-dependent oxidoreductase